MEMAVLTIQQIPMMINVSIAIIIVVVLAKPTALFAMCLKSIVMLIGVQAVVRLIINAIVNKLLDSMKSIYRLILFCLCCIPHMGFAQFHLSTYEWEARMQNMINNPFSFSEHRTEQRTKKPRKTTTPITKGDLVAEMTKDTETGLTTVRWNNGAVYVGEINYGEISGMGTMIYPDSSKYQGQWKNDRFHGVGTMEYADGSAYCGQWENGDPNGQGTFLTPEGVKYTAEFKDGVPRGKCILQDIDGRMYTARWVRGKLKEKSIKPFEEE